mgnify:FL=1
MSTQMNILLSKNQHIALKTYAKKQGLAMSRVMRNYIDSLEQPIPTTPNFVKQTGWCRPCNSIQFTTESRCDTCGEWAVKQ